jgi:hypothetical protein
MDPPVLLPLLDKLLAAQVLFTLRGWMDGWNCVAVEVLPSQEIFSRLISVPVPPSDLRMAIPGPPHSGESLASPVAAGHASAFVLKSHSSLHAFHASSPCVTWVSNPLVLTLTSPAVEDLDERAVGRETVGYLSHE